jgi:mercuric reductase
VAERVLGDEGVYVFTNVEVREVRRSAGSKVIVINRSEIKAEEILLATGRKPNVDLNLEAAGVELGPNGGIKVNDDLSTTNPNVYAAGDVIGEPMLESLAGYEVSIAAENALTGSRKSTNRKLAPQVIFTQPNIARVGSVEGYEVGSLESRVIWLSELPKASIIGDEMGLVKMTIERETKRIVSV